MPPTSIFGRRARPLGLATALLLAACASDREPPLLDGVRKAKASQGKAPVVVAIPTPVPANDDTPRVAGSGTSGVAEKLPSVIYFQPDAYEVDESYLPVLEAYAERLLAEPGLQLRIDGHTDDSGPADYNLELARMRAQMVMRELLSMGVPKSQLQVVGHGKGRPKARGASAKAQAANRRVELSYR
ncbi:MAG: OmpA family protein [Pseudomonadota bacterium]